MSKPTQHLLRPYVESAKTLIQLIHENPLPPGLKRGIIEALVGPYRSAAALQAAGLTHVEPRGLTAHELATLDAISGAGSESDWRLLNAVRRTRGDEIVAWTDITNLTCRMRVEALA